MNKQMLRFRESFRGYNRDDVNAYIEQISIMFSRKESELRAQISELEAKLSCSSNNFSLEQELKEVKVQLASSNELADSLRNELDAIKSEKNNNEEDEKSKLYDSMSAQVGNIIIVANSNAEKIVSDAKAEAEKIKLEAEVYSNGLKAEADAKIKEAELRSAMLIKEISNGCISDFTSVVSESGAQLFELTKTLKSKSEAIINEFNNKIKEAEDKYNI